MITVKTHIDPGPMYAKLVAAYRESMVALEIEAKRGAPGKIAETIHATPTGVFTSSLEADAPYAAPVEAGARPHKIEPRPGGILGNPRIGFVAGGTVTHPGMQGKHFMARALASFQTIFVQAGRRLF